MTALILVLMGVFLLGCDAADFSFSGLGLLGVLVFLSGLWVAGVFNRAVWIADDETSARLDEIDREIGR